MPGQHFLDAVRMALGQPKPLSVFIDDEHVAVAVCATEQGDGVMREAVVQGAEPFASA